MATFLNIKGLNSIQKGFYKDNYLNRKLGRVGMKYDDTTSASVENKDNNLEKNELIFSDNKKEFDKLLNSVVKNESLKEVILRNKENVYIDPSINKIVVNGSFYLDIGDSKEFEIGKQSYLRESTKDNEQYDKIVASFVSDETKEKNVKEIKRFFDYINNLNDNFAKSYLGNFSNIYNKYNKFKTEKDIEDFILNSNRSEFYESLKSGNSALLPTIQRLLKTRFLLKYNKHLTGKGWDFVIFLDKPNKNGDWQIVDTKKRDSALKLASQLEFTVEDLLGKDKDKIFVNNPNLLQISYDDKDWNSCYYMPSTKNIQITEKYLKLRKEAVIKDDYSTNSKEKYFVQTFLHEIGHSLEKTINTEKSEKKLINEFNKLVGWDENAKYSIFSEGVKSDGQSVIENVSYYARVKRDFKEGYEDLLPLTLKNELIINNTEKVEKAMISEYSNKSASESFAEYFGYYIAGRKNIDKDLKKWKSNKEEFLKNADGANWFPYNKPPRHLDKSLQYFNTSKDLLQYLEKEEIEGMHKLYEEQINYNMMIFDKIKQIVDEL